RASRSTCLFSTKRSAEPLQAAPIQPFGVANLNLADFPRTIHWFCAFDARSADAPVQTLHVVDPDHRPRTSTIARTWIAPLAIEPELGFPHAPPDVRHLPILVGIALDLLEAEGRA